MYISLSASSHVHRHQALLVSGRSSWIGLGSIRVSCILIHSSSTDRSRLANGDVSMPPSDHRDLLLLELPVVALMVFSLPIDLFLIELLSVTLITQIC